jgi:hypothetical protein
MLATASRVSRWLLVEHPGPWGPLSLPLSRMERAVGNGLVAAGAAAGARVLLLRRPLGVPSPPGRRVYAVESRPGREQVLTRVVNDDRALVDLALPFDASRPDGWDEVREPLLLVCTHGRHDQCCAVRGRPVAAALSALRPEQVWECSHIGGDRFAANLLVLPHGLYLGRVPVEQVPTVLAALDAGRLPLPYVRGRSSLPSPTQAAQHFARAATGRDRLDDLLPAAQTAAGTDTWRVALSGPGGPDIEVVVAYDRAGTGRAELLTCSADEAKLAPLFREVSLQVAPSVA